MLRKIAALVVCTLALCGTTLAQMPAPLFDKMLVFGDSLSDNGNLFTATDGQLLPPPYSNGRASNGEVWVEYLDDYLGVFMINNAYVGAQTGTGLKETPPSIAVPLELNQGDLRIPAIGTQQQQYLLADQPTENSLVVIWGGANDIFFGQANNDVSVKNIAQHIRKMAISGAETFLVPNMPPLDKTPYGVWSDLETQQILQAVSIDFNWQLAMELDALEKELGITIIQFDVYSLMSQVINDVIDNPGSHGFIDVTTPSYIYGPNPPEGFFFFDEVHPTTEAHKLLAEEACLKIMEELLSE
ncbi:MAG: SGNH/GDSL hydrolase family protein [Planctomycetaceae bacterium]|nr:SGNH/GDSL hydrolase family protein [Planctomycetaceae bacterium]